MKVTKSEKAEALQHLRELLKPGDTIYTKLDHVSRSGMMRHITPLILRLDANKAFNSPRTTFTGPDDSSHGMINVGESELSRFYLGYLAAKACGFSIARDHSLKMGGCGMDMGFALVYELSSAVFAGGFDCTGDKCPASDHSNVRDGEQCPICDKALTREHFRPESIEEAPEVDETGQTPERSYHYVMRVYGRKGFTGEPLHARKMPGRSYSVAVCSAECVSATWHHSSGGYALKHEWL